MAQIGPRLVDVSRSGVPKVDETLSGQSYLLF